MTPRFIEDFKYFANLGGPSRLTFCVKKKVYKICIEIWTILDNDADSKFPPLVSLFLGAGP